MKIFIDLGAYTGDTIKLALKRYKDFDKFYAFEPLTKNFDILKRDLSGIDKVVLLKSAADTASGHSKLFLGDAGGDMGGSLCENKTTCFKDQFETVECIDFSKFLTDNFNRDDEIVVKIDIEGKEYDIFEHLISQDTIGYIKKLYCEWHYDRIGVSYERHQRCVNKLRDLGFRLTGYTELDEYPKFLPLNRVRRRLRKYGIFIKYHFGELKNMLLNARGKTVK